MSRESKAVPTSGASDQPVATAPVLARWLGISGKAVYDLAKAGVLVRVSRDHFLLEENVRRYCEHIRRTTSRSPGEGAAPKDQPAANGFTTNNATTH
jgi:hypothetical protein